MAPTNITKWVSLIILSLLLKPQILTKARQQVPCMFLFGDSQYDDGNNNDLITTAKSNYPPYGIDFPDGPTGRFSNGLTTADFLTKFLGFQSPVLPFANLTGSDDMMRGVNYASGAAGILEETGALMGDRFTMNRQLMNHGLIIARIRILLDNNQTAVNDYLSKCLYVVNIGSNDYINNYYLPELPLTRLSYTPEMYADILIQRYSQQLTTLYNLGARSFVAVGLGLIGCTPQELANYRTNGAACVDSINNDVQLFNDRLAPGLIDSLNGQLPDARFTFINSTSISSGDHSLIGVRVTNASCCPVIRSTGLCVPNQVPCPNRNEYIFFDNYRTTEIVNRAMASRAYNKLLPTDAYPMDIRHFVQQ